MPDAWGPSTNDESGDEPHLTPPPELAPAQWVSLLRPLHYRIKSDIAATRLSRALASRHHKDAAGSITPLLASHLTRRTIEAVEPKDAPLTMTADVWARLGINPAAARRFAEEGKPAYVAESTRPVGSSAGHAEDLLRHLETLDGAAQHGVCDSGGAPWPIGPSEATLSVTERVLISDRARADFYLKRKYDLLGDTDSYVVELGDIKLLNDYWASREARDRSCAFNPWYRTWFAALDEKDKARLATMGRKASQEFLDEPDPEADAPLAIEDAAHYLRTLRQALDSADRVLRAIQTSRRARGSG